MILNDAEWEQHKDKIVRLTALEVAPVEALIPAGATVFDVGGNIGLWSASAAIYLRAKIKELHIFEPLPKAAAAIRNLKLIQEAGIFPHVHNVAVGAKAGTATLSFDSEISPLATLTGTSTRLPRRDVVLDTSMIVKVITLDDFCRENDILNIDYLKIDVEGYEDNVLQGAAELLRRKVVGTIAFEFGLNHIRLRQFFRFFWDFFEHFGYQIMLMRRGDNGFGLLPINEYSTHLEKFDVNRVFVATVRG